MDRGGRAWLSTWRAGSFEGAVQGGDSAVAFAQGCFELGDLGVFGGQPGP